MKTVPSVYTRVSMDSSKNPPMNYRKNLKKLQITANNRVIICGIHIHQYHRILSNNRTNSGFFSQILHK